MKEIQAESVRGVIFSPDRASVLLVKRKDIPIWELPGGGIDQGEEEEAAMLREIVEETGFTVKIERLVARYLPINRLAKPTLLYECSVVEGTATTSSETTEVLFFPLSNLPTFLPAPFPNWIFEAEKKSPFFTRKLTEVNYRTLFIYFLQQPILVIQFLKKLFFLRK